MRQLHLYLLCALLLAGCGESTEQSSYFPLNGEHGWSYRVETEGPNGRRVDHQRVWMAGETSLDDTTYRIRRWSQGIDYYLRADPTGIYRKARRTFIETDPRIDPAPRYILRAPFTVGTNWTSDTHPYLITRTGPGRIDYTRLRQAQMSYTITATDAAVTVPAGHFYDCLLVEGEAEVSIYGDAVHGTVQVPLLTREWYAPGVGLVKMERREVLDLAMVQGGVWRMELTAFH